MRPPRHLLLHTLPSSYLVHTLPSSYLVHTTLFVSPPHSTLFVSPPSHYYPLRLKDQGPRQRAYRPSSEALAGKQPDVVARSHGAAMCQCGEWDDLVSASATEIRQAAESISSTIFDTCGETSWRHLTLKPSAAARLSLSLSLSVSVSTATHRHRIEGETAHRTRHTQTRHVELGCGVERWRWHRDHR